MTPWALTAGGVLREGTPSHTADGAGWLTFLRGLVARGLSGAALVTSDGLR